MKTSRIPIKIPFPLLIALLFLITACDFEGDTGQAADDSGSAVPDKILHIETLAEDAFDSAVAGDNRQVELIGEKIHNEWWSVRPELAGHKIPDETLQLMDSTVSRILTAARNPPTVECLARKTNVVIGLTAGMLIDFDLGLPRNVFELDYITREIIVNGQKKQFAEAKARVAKLDEIWTGEIRRKVVKAGGENEAVALDNTILRLRRAAEGKKYGAMIREAQNSADILDAVKDLFRTSSGKTA